MDKLTNIIEAVLFASGKSVAVADIADKLGVTRGAVGKALEELKEKYGEEGGIRVLQFNGKAQLASNPDYKESVEAVLNPIREKELTRTILECAAIVAYKQPITRTEIELLRGLNSDYAVHALLELKLIYPCGRKDAVGRPILYATTDEFLKRFKLNSLEDLPDYDALMAAINRTEEKDNYLYAREEYSEALEESAVADGSRTAEPEDGLQGGLREADAEGDGLRGGLREAEGDGLRGGLRDAEGEDGLAEDSHGYEIPDFLRGLDESDLIKIG